MMNKNGFSRYVEFYIGRLRKEERHSTAHVYKDATFSFSKFCGTSNVSFGRIARECLRRYGQYPYECGLKPSTIPMYTRMFRCICNRGAEAGSASYVPRSFCDVHIGVNVHQREALFIGELHRLLHEDPKSERLRRTQVIAALVFQFCGMLFADLAHLGKLALDQNVLRYNRIKTRTSMSVEVLDTAKKMINRLRSNQDSHPDSPDYLFDILSSDKKRTDERAYREYQFTSRQPNNRLKGLARALRLKSPVISYTLCHSWAMIAKYRGVSIEMISESLGYKSVKTTQIYPRDFGLRGRTEVNKGNLSYMRSCCVDRRWIYKILIVRSKIYVLLFG